MVMLHLASVTESHLEKPLPTGPVTRKVHTTLNTYRVCMP